MVKRALDLGINMFDTAPSYSNSEALLGEALAGVPRDSYVLGTKCHAMSGGGSLRTSLQDSLRRLRTDHVDIFYLHGVKPDDYQTVKDRCLDELQDLRQAGLTRFIAVSELYERDPEHKMLQAALTDDCFDVIMVGHNMLSPSALSNVFPMAEKRQTGVVLMCAIRSVISVPSLLQRYIQDWKRSGVLAADAVPDAAPLDWVLGPGVDSLTAAAYKFAAEPAAVGSVLTGTASIDHLEANVQAILGPPLPAAVSRRLEELFIPIGEPVTFRS